MSKSATTKRSSATSAPIVVAKFPRTKIARIAIAKTPSTRKRSLRLYLAYLVGQTLFLANYGSATQSHPALIVDANTFYRNRITNTANRIDILNPTIVELGNVNQTLLAFNTLHKDTKISHRFHGTIVRFSYFYI
jgi:hypothetical protein